MSQSLSILGLGAFGQFMIPHLTPYFSVRLYDPYADINALPVCDGIEICDTIAHAAESDVIVIAAPVPAIESICAQLRDSGVLRAGQLVMDVGSVKVKPIDAMVATLPACVDIVGLHPLFGPQSGKNGIVGQNIAVVNVRGDRSGGVAAFLADQLRLKVIACSAEEHDKDVAYVQGLTHMIAKVVQAMEIPELRQTTKTYQMLEQMVGLIKNDSDELFKVIQTDNPYVSDVKDLFFGAVKDLEDRLK